jgi:hypothetical protein
VTRAQGVKVTRFSSFRVCRPSPTDIWIKLRRPRFMNESSVSRGPQFLQISWPTLAWGKGLL